MGPRQSKSDVGSSLQIWHGSHCDWALGVNGVAVVSGPSRLCTRLESLVGHGCCNRGDASHFNSLDVADRSRRHSGCSGPAVTLIAQPLPNRFK
jgi:hypothetical protein